MICKHLFLCILTVFFIIGCTTHPKIETYLSTTETPPPPFLKAKFSLTIEDSTDNNSLNAVALCVPNQRYRIEMYGPLGVHIGSFLWNNNEWSLYIPQEETALKGTGSSIALLDIPQVEVHHLLGLFWNQLLPGPWQNAAIEENGSQRLLSWNDSTHTYTAAVDHSSGEVKYVKLQVDTQIAQTRYSDYQVVEHYILPGTAIHQFDKYRKVTIELDALYLNKKEKEKYWNLTIPQSVTIQTQ